MVTSLWRFLSPAQLGGGPWGRPRARCRDFISLLALEHLRIPQENLESVTEERDGQGSLLDLLPL